MPETYCQGRCEPREYAHSLDLNSGDSVSPGETDTSFSIVAEPKPVALLAAIMLTLVAQRISGLAWAKVQRLPSGSAAS